MKFTVRTADLRLALRAVVLHAEPDSDFADIHRLRVDRRPDTVTFSATNRYTVGHAFANVWDQGDGEIGAFDLSPRNVAELLGLFKVPKEQGADHALTLEVTDAAIAVTEVCGMFDGKTLTLPRYPSDANFPDLAAAVAAMIEKRPTAKPAHRLLVSHHLLSLLVASAALYDQRLVIDPAGDTSPVLITAGESFVGVLMPIKPDEDTTARINGWQMDWLLRTSETVPAGA